MKKAATGLAGAVRIQQLKMDDLTRAENHGKRLDRSSQARVIFKDAPPLTTTGLELNLLYRKHVADAFIPKAKAKAMHVIVQFPTKLVDGESDLAMLHHARMFVQTVFGMESIFADRLDRDERGRHIVDIFIAPKYVKKTKHTEKTAVGMSYHLKELAKSQGRKTNVHETGRALQDAFFNYLKNQMGLDGVERGSPKVFAGTDWKAAEDLRLRELEDLKFDAEKEIAAAQMLRRDVEDAGRRDEEERTAARNVLQEAEAENRRTRQQLDLDVEELRASERKHKADAAKLAAQRLETNRMLSEARAEADRIRAKASADTERERSEAALEAQQNDARLALFARAVDDRNELNIQPTNDGFTMNRSKMSGSEQSVFDLPWPATLLRIGRELALILERVKKVWDDLTADKAKIALQERELEECARRLADREASVAKRIAQLDAEAAHQVERGQKLDAIGAALSDRTQSITKREAALEATVLATKRNSQRDFEWLEIAAKLQSREFYIEWREPRELRYDDNDRLVVGPLAERFATGRGPDWFERSAEVAKLVEEEISKVADTQKRATDREKELRELLMKAGPLLSPQAQAIAKEVADRIKIDPATAAVLQRQFDGGRSS